MKIKQSIKETIKFYTLCSKFKDTIRKGPLVWNAKRERIESVAEHVYGVQMLAISIYYQFDYKLDINKVIYMLAIHELEEIKIGDLAFYEITKEEKLIKGKEATEYILKDFLGKEEISKLLDEYNERKTEEAIFAYHCDKLECDIQMKLYDQEGCFDLNNQPNNPDFNYGTYKGTTRVTTNCCVPEYTANYINADKSNGPGIRAKCCDVCKKRCLSCCCGLECDFEMDIEDGNGNKSGNIMIYTGCYSEKVKDRGICYAPRPYYEINLPSLATSEQKFQIVADLIHFDLTNGAL